MMKMSKWLLISLLFFAGQAYANGDLWHQAENPSKTTKAKIYGSYSAGCIDGAQALEDGVGYYQVHRQRARFYGHPNLINYIQEYGRKIDGAGLGSVIISDSSQPRGGPFKLGSGHKSHQIGLDVDIWFKRLPPKQRQRRNMKELLVPISLRGDEGRHSLNESLWDGSYAAMLQLAADDKQVERIFVNPAIKRKLCETYRGDKWLSKIRPWYGHHDHFHVRLRCPEGDGNCKPQAAVPPGDGCDSMSWWFAKPKVVVSKGKASGKKKRKKKVRKKPKYPNLPMACNTVIQK